MNITPGAKPASRIPSTKRIASKAGRFLAAAMQHVTAPHNAIIVGTYIDGRVLARMRLLGISKTTYEMKNMTRARE